MSASAHQSGANPRRADLSVGAGIAGLATASSLQRAGIETVILEARSRIGGRLHTVDLAGTPVDLGGSWIHHPHRQSADGVLRRVRRSARPR
ncbi:MAG TPA: FAD-dependent oxidoreductase [Mycobacterium sp.]|nr:FAD-dependent oxidoreductase [Mycobacterium sp.]